MPFPVAPNVPVCMALLICDGIEIHSHNGKMNLLGLHNAVRADSFPFRLNEMAVYSLLNDAFGRYQVIHRIVDASELRPPVFEFPQEILWENPLNLIETSIVIPDLEFPEPGEYRLQVIVNGTLVAERRLMLNQIVGKPNETGESEEQEGS